MKKSDWKSLALCIIIPLAVGGAAAFLTRGSMDIYDSINTPSLAPPGWLFPVVWTLLYILMGVASWLVYTSDKTQQRIERALKVYAANLAINFFWSILFFSLRLFLASFLWLLLLWLVIAVNILLFYYIRKPAGKLLIPYLLWVSFAGYLNFAILLLN